VINRHESFSASEVFRVLKPGGIFVTQQVGGYFAKIIEWEFPGFSVERCFDQLCMLQEQVDKNGFIRSREHRFLLVATK